MSGDQRHAGTAWGGTDMTDDRMNDDRSLVDLSAYARAVRRRLPLVLLVAALAAGLGYVAKSSSTPTYTSTAVLQVNEGLFSILSGSRSGPNMANEQQVARSTRTTALAAEKLGTGLTATEFGQRATPTHPADANTLVLTFEAPTPSEAQRGATAWAEAYLENRRASFERDLEQTRLQVDERAAPLEQAYTDALAAAEAAAPGTPAEDRADAQVNALGDQLATVRGQLDALNALVVDPGEVITEPTLPTASEGLPLAVYLAAGLVIGLLVGAAVAIAVEHRFGRVHTPADVRSALHVPAWTLDPRRTSRDDPDPALEAVAARLPSAARAITIADLGQGAASAVAPRLAQVLDSDGTLADVVPTRQLAQTYPSAVVRLAPVSDITGPEAAAAMARSDGVLLVVQPRTRTSRLLEARRAIDDSSARLLAVVLTREQGSLSARSGPAVADEATPTAQTATATAEPRSSTGSPGAGRRRSGAGTRARR